MKRLLTILGIVFAASAFGTDLTVHLGTVSVSGTHTNFSFLCHVTITNGADAILTVPLGRTNQLSRFPGLALKVSDMNGRVLKIMDHLPLHRMTWTFSPGTHQEFKLTYVNLEGSLPDTAAAVRLHIEGSVLSGS